MSWWWLLIPVGLLWLVSGWIWARGRRYRRVFHLDHVREVVLGLGPQGAAALERTGEPLFGATDPRVLGSSEGLILSYVIGRSNELFVHRLLLEHVGGVTTYPVARRFLALALLVFDPDGECDRVQTTPERVFFAEWRVGQERQAELNARGFALPPGRTDDEIRALIAAADARAAQLGQILAENPQGPVDPPNSHT